MSAEDQRRPLGFQLTPARKRPSTQDKAPSCDTEGFLGRFLLLGQGTQVLDDASRGEKQHRDYGNASERSWIDLDQSTRNAAAHVSNIIPDLAELGL